MTVRIIHGDCREVLPTLAADSFDCVVTSPPYWGLRDYGVDGQIGLEPTLAAYLETMVGVMREVRRVLKSTGTAWLNIGDGYNNFRTQKGPGQQLHGRSELRGKPAPLSGGRGTIGLKEKDLLMVPNRLAILLQEPWYAGKIKDIADRIWLGAMIDAEGCMFIHKRKAGTSAYSTYTKADGTVSIYDRTNDTYSAGMEVANTSLAIVERCKKITGIGSICSQSPEQNDRRKQTIYRWSVRSNECRWIIEEIYPHLVGKQQQARVLLGCTSSGINAAAAHAALIDLHNGKPSDVDSPAPKSLFETGWYIRSEIIWAKKNCMPESVSDRPTSAHEKVWLLTKSERYFFDADAIREDAIAINDHDATGGRYEATGQTPNAAARHRKRGIPPRHAAYESSDQSGLDQVGRGYGRNARNVWLIASEPYRGAHYAVMPSALAERCIKAGSPAGGSVLDPFGGAGTTGLVADRLGRDATLIELNPANREMAHERVRMDGPLFSDVRE